MRIFFIVALFCGVIAVTPAFATPQMGKQSSAERFTGMDADGNSLVSKDEFFKALPNMQPAAFESIDASKDGAISLEEWEAFNQGHGSSMPPEHQQGMQKDEQHSGEKKDEQPKHDMMMPERSKK